MNSLSSPNFGPHRYTTATKLAAIGAAIITAGCSEPLPDPGTGLPAAGYVRQENGHTYVTTCFTDANAPGSVERLNLYAWSSFYAGRRHYSVDPKLVKEDLPTAERPQAFGTETPITLPQLIGRLTAGQLRLHPTPYANSRVSLKCDYELKKVTDPREFNNQLAEVDWDDSGRKPTINGVDGPFRADFKEGDDIGALHNF
jgi:hypothetical protein